MANGLVGSLEVLTCQRADPYPDYQLPGDVHAPHTSPAPKRTKRPGPPPVPLRAPSHGFPGVVRQEGSAWEWQSWTAAIISLRSLPGGSRGSYGGARSSLGHG